MTVILLNYIKKIFFNLLLGNNDQLVSEKDRRIKELENELGK